MALYFKMMDMCGQKLGCQKQPLKARTLQYTPTGIVIQFRYFSLVMKTTVVNAIFQKLFQLVS